MHLLSPNMHDAQPSTRVRPDEPLMAETKDEDRGRYLDEQVRSSRDNQNIGVNIWRAANQANSHSFHLHHICFHLHQPRPFPAALQSVLVPSLGRIDSDTDEYELKHRPTDGIVLR